MFCFIRRSKSQDEFFFSDIPLLYIQYAVIWNFHNIIPNECANITVRLNNSKSTLEEDFLKPCDTLNLNFTVRFTFETLTFTVRKTRDKNVWPSRCTDEILTMIKNSFESKIVFD